VIGATYEVLAFLVGTIKCFPIQSQTRKLANKIHDIFEHFAKLSLISQTNARFVNGSLCLRSGMVRLSDGSYSIKAYYPPKIQKTFPHPQNIQ
jgi:hypothetical protein